MTNEQKYQIAIVLDMTEGQLRAALYQIVMGDNLKNALDKARSTPANPPKKKHYDLLKWRERFGD